MGSEASESDSVRDDEENVAAETFSNNVADPDAPGVAGIADDDYGESSFFGLGPTNYGITRGQGATGISGYMGPFSETVDPLDEFASSLASLGISTTGRKVGAGLLGSLVGLGLGAPVGPGLATSLAFGDPTKDQTRADKESASSRAAIGGSPYGAQPSGPSESDRDTNEALGLLAMTRPVMPQPVTAPGVPQAPVQQNPYMFLENWWDGNQFYPAPLTRRL